MRRKFQTEWSLTATARLAPPAHVAQWIERLPPEQKVVGPIPTVGAMLSSAQSSFNGRSNR